MNDFGFFKPDENQDKCQHQKAGDYCMKSGKSTKTGSEVIKLF